MKYATIFGGGFGLYGYLPALEAAGLQSFIVNYRHRTVFKSQKKLAPFLEVCHFATDEEMFSLKSDLFVIAVNPQKQEQLVDIIFRKEPGKILLLEKPLACDPASAENLIKFMRFYNINYFCNYIFSYATWFRDLAKIYSGQTNIQINWSFMAHHFSKKINTWKNVRSMGGGVIRFYGIHLIYIASLLGFSHVKDSSVTVDCFGSEVTWACTLADINGRTLSIYLDICAPVKLFNVCYDTASLVDLEDPFDLDVPNNENLDRRHNLIREHINYSLRSRKKSSYQIDLTAISLWKAIEQLNVKYKN